MPLARAAMHVFADHRAVWLQDRDAQRRLDAARMARAQAIMARSRAEIDVMWQVVPREADRFALNPHMLEALARVKLMRVAAQAEAELVAGDLWERERVERDVQNRKRSAQRAFDAATEKARRAAMTPVERRKIRRAELYQQNKRARFMVIGG